MNKAILMLRLKNGAFLYHSRSGLTTDIQKAWRFKTIEHGVKIARKRYSHMLGVNYSEWRVLTRAEIFWENILC